MRIGFDARMVYYSQAGISQYILRLLQSLQRLDCGESEFVLLQSRKDPRNLVTCDRFRRVSLWTPSHHPLEQWTLPLEIQGLHLDVLHSPDFIPPFRCNCKSVITVHDLAFLLYPHFLTKESARYYGQIDQAVRRADHIIAVSEATRRDIMERLGASANKITVIHEAADPMFRPLDRQAALERIRERHPVGEEFILFVSTIEPRKNVPTLLRAYRQFRDDYKQDVKLVFAGSRGWLFDDVFALVEQLGLAPHCVFLGRVDSEDLVHLYNAARVLVQPSYYEGFGLPPLEAMACGTPVIVSNVSALPEVVGDAGILVNPNSVDELAVALWRMLNDEPLRQQFVVKGLARAKSFSWEKAAEKTLEVYRRLANGG
ncbi:MAG: glycosyltransferase family 4 protein [Chloroflexi bacterium]|nr:glycosyltransferase family 4 protein [Chloroflexota bacterium]